MSANSVCLLVLILSILAGLWLVAASVKLGLRWANVAEISLWKGFGIYVLFSLVGVLIISAETTVLFMIKYRPAQLLIGILALVTTFATPGVIVAMIYKVRLWRGLIATIPYFLISLVTAFLLAGVTRMYVYEAFSIPTNAMAPTLRGERLEAPCPRCGAAAIGSPPDPRWGAPTEGVQMICSKELQSVLVKDPPQTRHEGDRILACKVISPRRWDLIVFRYPADPSVYYVKRLVGLPGEKLAIHDDAIWINGERMEPPESIRGIRYSPTIESSGRIYSGSGSRPVALGPDEYFVLGDFVDQAADSRLWEQGAPGYPPYAVPASHIVGVVINIYWPPNRWTSFR
jgi:signal peptidase I